MRTQPITNPADLPTDLIDVARAARLAKVHISAVHRWVQKAKIRAWKRCGRYLVSQAELFGLFEPVTKPTPIVEKVVPAEFARRRDERLRAAGLMQ